MCCTQIQNNAKHVINVANDWMESLELSYYPNNNVIIFLIDAVAIAFIISDYKRLVTQISVWCKQWFISLPFIAKEFLSAKISKQLRYAICISKKQFKLINK